MFLIFKSSIDSHVCSFERIYYFDKRSKKIKSKTHYWEGNYPRLADLKNDGQKQFITEDYKLESSRWTEREDANQRTGGPIQIWQWTKNNELKNVSRGYPGEIRKHAKACLGGYGTIEHAAFPSESNIIAYVGDLCLLGETNKALSELNKLQTDKIKKAHVQIIQQLEQLGYLKKH